jgi:class 3 adenylate cyclase
MTESQPRRLAAILAADIAGYSALMGANEARTVRAAPWSKLRLSLTAGRRDRRSTCSLQRV